METKDIRVRYGKDYDRPKNTLVTVRDGDYIYFGISRCNLDAGDTFTKARGKQIAAARANLAISDTYGTLDEDPVKLHGSHLRGRVSQEDVVSLLDVFSDIDFIMYDRATDRDHVGV